MGNDELAGNTYKSAPFVPDKNEECKVQRRFTNGRDGRSSGLHPSVIRKNRSETTLVNALGVSLNILDTRIRWIKRE